MVRRAVGPRLAIYRDSRCRCLFGSPPQQACSVQPAYIWSARLTTLRGAFGCEVLDVSLGGARLRLGMPLAAQQPLTLSIEGLDPIHAEVVWQGDPIGIRTVGIRFTDATAYVSAILARLPPRPAAP